MVDVDGSSQFSVDLQPKSIGLVSWSGGLLTQPQKPYQLATNRNMKPAGRRTTATVYIYSGGRLPLLSARPAVTPPPTVRRLLPILLLGEQRHDGCKQLA